MNKSLLSCISFLLIIGCEVPKKDTPSSVEPINVPVSYLNIEILFHADDITEGLNDMMPSVIMDQGIAINDKGDSAFVKIVRTGKIDLKFRGGYAYASLPIRVKAHFIKKVMGVTFSNEDAPLEFKAVATAKTEVTLSEDWDLVLSCNHVELDWKDNPNIKVLGFNLDLGKKLDKAMKENQADIASKLCTAVNSKLNFRKTITKVWDDLQKPIRISQKPVDLWLFNEPESLNAKLLPLRDDLLTISVALRSTIHISPVKGEKIEPIKLPKREVPLDSKSSIAAYVNLNSPLKQLENLLQLQLVGSEYEYEDYHAKIESIAIRTNNQKLVVKVGVSGSFSGLVEVSGTPELTRDHKFKLNDFTYTAELDDQVVTVTDWAMHEFAENYLAERVSIDASLMLGNLDSLINTGINTKFEDKLVTTLDIRSVSSYQIYLGKEDIQWIFYVQGSGKLALKSGLFQKK